MTQQRTEKEQWALEAWRTVVEEGLKDGRVQRSTPTHEQDRLPKDPEKDARPRNIELIVEDFHGCKRATGVGPTEREAAIELWTELARFFPDGPAEPESVAVVEGEGDEEE